MKRFTVALLLVCSLAPLALYAKTDNKPPKNEVIPSLEEQLRDTLRLAFNGRFADFKSGRSSLVNLIRINRELYEAEIACAEAAERLAIHKAYVDRAMEFERFAELGEKAGVGTRTDVLEAKAARLTAMIEINAAEAPIGN